MIYHVLNVDIYAYIIDPPNYCPLSLKDENRQDN